MNLRGDIVLGLDPSSTIIGYGALTRGGRFIEAGLIWPKSHVDASWDRIVAMSLDLDTLLDRLRPGTVLVEWTKGKVGRRHGGLGAGLAVYGCGVGAAAIVASRWCTRHGGEFEAVCENTWTRGVPKDARQLAIAKLYPEYAEHLAEDAGGDMADGIGLCHWWIKEQSTRNLF